MKLVIVLIIVLFLCLSTIKLDEHFENEVKPKICSKPDDLEFVCNNNKICCQEDSKNCHCNNNLVASCEKQYTQCQEDMCPNMEKDDCEKVCGGILKSCCSGINQTGGVDNVGKVFSENPENKYSEDIICRMSGKYNKQKCGKLCYQNNECKSFSLANGNFVCSLHPEWATFEKKSGSQNYSRV